MSCSDCHYMGVPFVQDGKQQYTLGRDLLPEMLYWCAAQPRMKCSASIDGWKCASYWPVERRGQRIYAGYEPKEDTEKD